MTFICSLTNFVATEHCNGDYLEIREDGVHGNILRRVCSHDAVNSKLKTGHSLYIKLRAYRNDSGLPEELRLMFNIGRITKQ